MRNKLTRGLSSESIIDYIDNAVIGLHWVDSNGIIKWANKAELAMLGYESTEYVGHHIAEFHIDTEKITDILSRLHANECLQAYESSLLCKDGSVKNVQLSSNVYRENGEFIHTRCFTVDVTQQKLLYRALKESELRYKQVVQKLKVPVYTTDINGYINLYNEAAAELWGREPNIGQDLWCGSYKIQRKDGSSVPLDNCQMAITLKEGRPVIGEEIMIVRPDETIRNVIPHPQPIFDEKGDVVGAINMLLDVTQIRHSETALVKSEQQLRLLATSLEIQVELKTADLKAKNEELKRSEERYHRMIDEVEDYAILLLDADGIIKNWNKGAEKIKGYSEPEIIGKHFRNFYREEDRKDGLPEKLLNLAGTNGKAIHEGWRLRKDGSCFWGSIVITALHDATNHIVGFSKVTRDLTDRKRADEAAAAYTRLLEFQNGELEQFAYAASHDMKEPLRKINFYIDYLSENATDSLDEKCREYLGKTTQAAKRMSCLIDDLLVYSRTSAPAESFEEVDLNTILDEIIFSHKELINSADLVIKKVELPTLPVIAFQFRQLFENIINNAIKYRHPERTPVIELTCQLTEGSGIDSVEADPFAHYFMISVIDNGIGFDEEDADKVFEIFRRLNNSREYRGTGLGLAICKKIIQNHRGIIKATGVKNKGARFDLYIPSGK